uniref:NADH-ubiquinone oxidoreductase chain 2 n=1 Tax=Geoffmonteithia queenslanda TaxID=2546578 RepID=A0A6H0N461_9CUCU|nr:NADH dehydrogenase subunit 2 [Geoffmonteithia queenslanda]
MMKFYKLMFLSSLITGSLIAVSSYSWLSMWIGLEINLLSIIPLLSNLNNLYPSESALKYFITQVMASTILLFSIVTPMNLNDFAFSEYSLYWSMIMNSAILTKMGAAPFHAWFPEVMDGLNWPNCLMMLTWQKLAPMVILMYSLKMTLFLSSIILCSTIIGGILGLNQISLRKILAYSSINHISWMMGSMLNSQAIWLVYFIIYTIITINIVIMFHVMNIFFLKQLFNSINYNKPLKILFLMNFLSLGGLPPFLGFFPKWLTVNGLVENNFLVLSTILIISTLVTLFFYMRVTFSTMVINSSEIIIGFPQPMMFFIVFSNLISLAGLIMCTLIFNVV